MKTVVSRRRLLGCIAACCLVPFVLSPPARAHGGAPDASVASSLALSLPVAALSVAPLMILGAGVTLTVVAVEASATGVVWLVRRVSDGATASLRFSGEAAASAAVATGTVLSATAISAGWLLSAAGEVICLVPNALGESLLYNERVR